MTSPSMMNKSPWNLRLGVQNLGVQGQQRNKDRTDTQTHMYSEAGIQRGALTSITTISKLCMFIRQGAGVD